MGISPNLASYVGHNTVRRAAGVTGATVSAEQADTMRRLVREAMEAGALGLLHRAGVRAGPAGHDGGDRRPGARRRRVPRLTTPATSATATPPCRRRSRSAWRSPAAPGRRCRSRTSTCATTPAPPPGAWQRAVDTVERARRDGMDVMADMTPFREGMGSLAAILPPWFVAEGPERAAALLADPAVRARLRGECDRYWRFIHRGEWHRVRRDEQRRVPGAERQDLQPRSPRCGSRTPGSATSTSCRRPGRGMGALSRDGACCSPTSTWPS